LSAGKEILLFNYTARDGQQIKGIIFMEINTKKNGKMSDCCCRLAEKDEAKEKYRGTFKGICEQ
jgi:hypothetical protein